MSMKLFLDKYRAFDRWMGMCDVHRGIEALKREERREKREEVINRYYCVVIITVHYGVMA